MEERVSFSTTFLLGKMSQGDREARDRFLARIYDELKALAGAQMRGERAGHTLQPTALVNEAYVRLAELTRMEWKGRAHFFAVTAEILRRILVDHARARGAAKRGGGRRRVELEDAGGVAQAGGVDIVGLDEALKKLAALSERQARVVEMKFFAGLETKEIAEVIGVSEKTVKNDWRFARAWLREELAGGSGVDSSSGEDETGD